MCQLTASLIITACLLNIYHHRPDVPPPVWLRKLVNGCLASLLCINCGKRSHCRGKSPKDQYNPSSDTPSRSINLTPNHYAGSQEVTLPGYIHKYVIQRSEQVGKASMDEFNKSEWQNIARILDRLFFVTFTTFNTLISVVILITLNQWFLFFDRYWLACIDNETDLTGTNGNPFVTSSTGGLRDV